MATFLKRGKTEQEINEADLKTKEIVSTILEEIEKDGDLAVRKYSERFDKWSPQSFRLSNDEIKKIMDSVPPV